MALFQAAALLSGKNAHPVDIKLGTTTEDGVEVPVILTLNMCNELRRAYAEAEELYHASTRIPVLSRKEIKRRKKRGQQTEAKITNNFQAYCHTILEAGYVSSQNIIDDPSKENMLLAIDQEPGFAAQLALSLNYYFSGEDRFDFMEVEGVEKN